MFEVRQIIDDPFAVDGPLIARTEDYDEANRALDQAVADWYEEQGRKPDAGQTEVTFVTVLIDWSSCRPWPATFKNGPDGPAWLTRVWDVVTIESKDERHVPA